MEQAADLPSELTLHAASLRRVARALVRDDAGAEDLLQEAHLARLQRPNAAAESLVAWFRGTLRRMASGEHRGRTRAAQREASVARPEALESAAERSAALESQERLVALVRALPEPQGWERPPAHRRSCPQQASNSLRPHLAAPTVRQWLRILPRLPRVRCGDAGWLTPHGLQQPLQVDDRR
jgi:hypothetical protein